MAKGSIDYSRNVYTKINREKLRKDVVNATESSSELRKEIARIFQKANRRIQNIEQADLYSPAVEALGLGDRAGKYSKFFMGGVDWFDLKAQYGKAIAFLREPTSTVTGARQYHEYIRQTYELSEDEYKLMLDHFRGKLQSISDTDFVERYLMRYKDFTGELETAASDVSSQIESDAMMLENALQQDIDDTVDELLSAGIDDLLDELENLSGSIDF